MSLAVALLASLALSLTDLEQDLYLGNLCYPNLLDDNGRVPDNLVGIFSKSPFPCEQMMYLERACRANGTAEVDFLAEQQCLCGGNFFDASRGCLECTYAHGFFDAEYPLDKALSKLTSASSAECSATPVAMNYAERVPGTLKSATDDVATLTSDRFPSDTAISNYWTGATTPIAGQITGSATGRAKSDTYFEDQRAKMSTESMKAGGAGTSSANTPSPSSTNGAAAGGAGTSSANPPSPSSTNGAAERYSGWKRKSAWPEADASDLKPKVAQIRSMSETAGDSVVRVAGRHVMIDPPSYAVTRTKQGFYLKLASKLVELPCQDIVRVEQRERPTKVPDEAGKSQVQHVGIQARAPQVEHSADHAKEPQLEYLNQELIDQRPPRINYIYRGPMKILQINDALISAIELGTRHLQEIYDRTTGPYADKRDADMEGLILKPLDVSTLRDPSVNSINVLVDRLQRISQAILRRTTEPPPPPEEPTVFYRVTTPESHTTYDYRLGFWSARGLPDHDFEEPPSEDEFCEHIKGTKFKSPYISMTSNPGRACQYGNNFDGRLVYEIDAAKLRQMRVHIESTTAIAERYGVSFGRPDYVTSWYWLARFWIPAECRRVHPFTQFRKSCVEAGFVDRKTLEMVKPEEVPADAYEKLAALLEPKVIAQEFADESDDDSPVARENPSPIQPPLPATDPTLQHRLKDLSLSDT
ncbi:hypothetical protein V492_07378 [Pseudogymnoascus sp. VKM F-4246]|nr:hypothetical protein V492_07378 [Pseudogymnoascus sp. VKM F-4246]